MKKIAILMILALFFVFSVGTDILIVHAETGAAYFKSQKELGRTNFYQFKNSDETEDDLAAELKYFESKQYLTECDLIIDRQNSNHDISLQEVFDQGNMYKRVATPISKLGESKVCRNLYKSRFTKKYIGFFNRDQIDFVKNRYGKQAYYTVMGSVNYKFLFDENLEEPVTQSGQQFLTTTADGKNTVIVTVSVKGDSRKAFSKKRTPILKKSQVEINNVVHGINKPTIKINSLQKGGSLYFYSGKGIFQKGVKITGKSMTIYPNWFKTDEDTLYIVYKKPGNYYESYRLKLTVPKAAESGYIESYTRVNNDINVSDDLYFGIDVTPKSGKLYYIFYLKPKLSRQYKIGEEYTIHIYNQDSIELQSFKGKQMANINYLYTSGTETMNEQMKKAIEDTSNTLGITIQPVRENESEKIQLYRNSGWYIR